jgi:hypothetical protein
MAAFDRPTKIAIARWIAGQGASRRGVEGDVGNHERWCLQAIVAALDAEPPQTAKALQEAEQGVAHAWRGRYVEARPEAWECAAVAALLRDE